MTGIFSEWQPRYAERSIATFPVDATKKPLAKNYLKAGPPYSAKLAKRFPDANAFGFALGPQNGITVLDVDTPDERVLADALARHGQTKIVIRSGSGNYQAYYRHNGEGRHIRPDESVPIDVLGGGYVVGPPSQGAKGVYEIIAGSLDDLNKLPPLQNFTARGTEIVESGRRNNELWLHCMRNAPSCDDFNALLDVAETYNADALQPLLPADEVVEAARKIWNTTKRGENRFGKHGAFLSVAAADRLVSDPHMLALLVWLRAHNSPSNPILIADGLAKTLGWTLRRLRDCRRRAVAENWVEQISPPMRGQAAVYRWTLNGLAILTGHSLQSERNRLSGPQEQERKGEGFFQSSSTISLGHSVFGNGSGWSC